ncbi:MAG: hypothetical protein WCF85_17105 [Rhodospirillaceae bacterium]
MIAGLSLPSRIAISIVAMLVLASMLTILLCTSRFRDSLEQREFTIYAFVAADLRGLIENGLTLGLPLKLLHNNQALIERRKAADPNIIGISIFGEDGRILYDTDHARPGSLLPPDQQGERNVRRKDGFGVATVLLNPFGQRAGGLLLRFDNTRIEREITAIAVELLRAALLITALTAVGIIAGLALLLRPIRQTLHDETDLLNRITEIEAAERFAGLAHRTLTRLSRAERLIERIGFSGGPSAKR